MLKATQELVKLQDFFERTYIINLPDRADRRQQMLLELERIQMPLARGKVEFFPAIRPEAACAFPNIGVLGCFLSHLEVLKQARKLGLANVLILEDDTAFTPSLAEAETAAIRQLSERDWSIVYLGFGPLPGYGYKDYYGTSLELTSKDNPIELKRCELPPKGSHCYGVHGNAFDSLITFLETLLENRLQQRLVQMKGSLHLDGAYIDTALYLYEQQHPEPPSLIACPNLAIQRSSRSDITPGKLDRFPLPPQVVEAVRSLKRRLLE